ncbi:cytochrome P450 [Chryseobacterium sp. ISL-6]|uniref:cytochrome P450 n=1 Tax=Chryseobacterium sp. ISL-6 TaxID=2819143 RepID=UPI001BE7E9B1|nr:cytochrome P450 [Chryseobacterium sp. ISL-6]MBT2621281.1 cytochrome P450 [Chryseobacterium sp. ISL-6]
MKNNLLKSFLGDIPNLFSEKTPYKDYKKIREKTPLYRISPMRWMVMKYEDAVSLMQNPSVSHWGQDTETQNALFGKQKSMISKTMYAYAPEIDSPYRKNVLHGLAARNLKFEKEEMKISAEKFLKECKEKGKFDFINDFAHHYTFETISRIIGIPEEDISELTEVVSKLDNGYLKLINNLETSNPAEQNFIAFLRKFIHKKEKALGKDLASALIESCQSTDESTDFALCLLIFLFYAGHDNMMNFLGNGFLSLYNNQHVFNKLKSNPQLIPNSIDELLRFDSPVQFFTMYTKNDIIIRNTKISAGCQILVCVGSANRDPEKFENPDEIKIDRNPQHLSYGFGAYRCIGARLAQLQSATAIEVLVENLSIEDLKVSNLEWKNEQYIQRGPKKLLISTK